MQHKQRWEKFIQNFGWETWSEETKHKDIRLDEMILLKWILKAGYENMWSGIFWLRIGQVADPCEHGNGKFGDDEKFQMLMRCKFEDIVFWGLTECSMVKRHHFFAGTCYSISQYRRIGYKSRSYDGTSIFLWKVGIFLQNCVISHPRRQYISL